MLVVSGVYYPVEVLPEWMQWIAKISPATYALRGCRDSILLGAGLALGRRLAAARDRRCSRSRSGCWSSGPASATRSNMES